jgi:hypothetical protein
VANVRSRTVRPEFWSDEKLAKLSRDARLLFIGLWNTADDYGITKGHSAWLKSQIFPYDEIKPQQFSEWIQALVSARMVARFVDSGEQYLLIRNFLKYQKVNHPSAARNPAPPDGFEECSCGVGGGLSEPSVSPQVVLPSETETESDTDSDSETEAVSRARTKKPKSPRFTPPSLEEVRVLWTERGYSGLETEPTKFWGYYTSNGWRVGKNPMEDWKAAAAGWNTRSSDMGSGQQQRRQSPSLLAGTVGREEVPIPDQAEEKAAELRRIDTQIEVWRRRNDPRRDTVIAGLQQKRDGLAKEVSA